jgi:hypothetical protein
MIILVDSFQHTLDHDTNQFDQLKPENEMEKRILNNLTQLTEEYSVDNKLPQDKNDISIDNRLRYKHESNQLFKEFHRKQSLFRIEKITKQYYMLMENLEYRIERHEQLTKSTQRSIKMTLIDQENRKVTKKK